MTRSESKAIIGSDKIIDYLHIYSKGSPRKGDAGGSQHDADDELAEHWRTTLEEGDEKGDAGEAMERAKRLALEESFRHKETRKPSRAVATSHEPPQPDYDDDPSIDEDEPAMKKYWENQRES